MSILRDMRMKLAEMKASEFATMEDQPALKEMWDQLQALRGEMNAAKKVAMLEAAKPYMDTIQEIETRYAFLLRLSAG
jgi:hypothetical protein